MCFSLHEQQCHIKFVYILYVCTVNVFVVVSVPDSINYGLKEVEISEDSFQISWKVSSEMLLVIG